MSAAHPGTGSPQLTVAEFDRQFVALRPNLVSFLFRFTTRRKDAEDYTQEAYVRARRGLDRFAGRSSLKTWVFQIAANLARDDLRARARWNEDTQDRCKVTTRAAPAKVERMQALVDAAPVEQYDAREHIDYCFTCISKTLQLDQQLAVLLKHVYEFTVPEIMEILELSEGKVKHALADGRRTLTDVFDRRCALVNRNGTCHECSEINGFVNPKQEVQERMHRLEMVQAAESGESRERLLDLRAALVRGVDPLATPTGAMHEYLLELMAEEPQASAK